MATENFMRYFSSAICYPMNIIDKGEKQSSSNQTEKVLAKNMECVSVFCDFQ